MISIVRQVSDWMRRLAAQFGRFRSEYPEDQLLIVFDIDGTILDMRHMVRHVLLSFDRAHSSDWFHGLTADDVIVHENQVDQLLRDMALPAPVAERAYRWYLEQRWQPEAVLAAHRPYQGVLDVIRWFQIQPGTSVALNTGRPEHLRAQTLQSLNALGEEYRVEFSSELLHMNPRSWEEAVAQTKVAALTAFRDAGYRVFAVVDNEPCNIRAMAEGDASGEILFLHAGTLYESARTITPRTVSGEAYDITALVSEREIPQHVQMVWHGVNDEWNLRQFLASRVTWGECDLRVDPLGRLVLRHDSFEETPWRSVERLMRLPELLDAFGEYNRGLKLDLKQPDHDVLHAALELIDGRLPEDRLWFNATIESLGEPGFRELVAKYPTAIRQCPIDFLAPLVFSAPGRARELLDMLRGWGVNRFSIAWGTSHTRRLFDQLERWGQEVNIYAVPDLAAFLQAALLLPRSLTADFNFPQWHYFGRGSGERLDHYTYRIDRPPRSKPAESRDGDGAQRALAERAELARNGQCTERHPRQRRRLRSRPGRVLLSRAPRTPDPTRGWGLRLRPRGRSVSSCGGTDGRGDSLSNMDAAEALTFARRNPRAVLATMKHDGTPQLSPVLVGVDSQDRLVISTRDTAIKTLNVRRDPRAWLCVLNDRFFGDWAQLSGDVEVVSLPEAMEPLVEYYRSISGEHPDWDDYRAAMIKQRRCLIRITPTKAGPTVFG